MNFSDGVIRWFHSYLSSRSQVVIDSKGIRTDFLSLTSGIPQVSNTGPLAFLIFVNTIVLSLLYCSNTCMLFADDFQIYLQCKRDDLSDCISRLSEDANRVADWTNNNGIELNAKKKLWVLFLVQSRTSCDWTLIACPADYKRHCYVCKIDKKSGSEDLR